MPPDLVVANAAYKVYPGGVVVVRAADWMAGARGSLSSEADARSAAGTVVRDSQTVTTSLFSDNVGAFQEADDTLVIPLANIGLAPEFRYIVLASLLIEGDWDPTNADTSRTSTQEDFFYACHLRWYDATYGSDATPDSFANFLPRGLDNYRIIGWGGNWALDEIVGDEVLHWRAYSQDGCSTEFLIDQIYFVPAANFPGATGPNNDWRADDFELIPGQAGTYGFYSLSNGEWVDGADGGDSNGKFTWHPVTFSEPTNISGGDGGGDYQRVANSADGEYFQRIVADGGGYYWLADSAAGYAEPAASDCYALHGGFYVPAQEWVNDDFSRTNGSSSYGAYGDPENTFDPDAWGTTPQGFPWRGFVLGPVDYVAAPFGNHRHGSNLWTDGSRGGMSVIWNGDFDVIHTVGASLGGSVPGGSSAPGGSIRADNISISGFCTPEEAQAPLSGGGSSYIYVSTGYGRLGNYSDFPQEIQLRFDIIAKSWSLIFYADGSVIYGPVDVSSWWSPGDTFGFRLEIRRYLVRVKFWDASGAEPGAWNYEDFRPIIRSGTVKTYPYQTAGVDDLRWSILESDRFTCTLWHEPQTDHSTAGVYNVMFDDVVVEYDPGGTNESAFANIERPEGNEVGQIELPAGCQHLVYWGRRDWTEYVVGDGPYLEFSAKVWNDPGAAELQRSEGVWWWFRVSRGIVIPMNWRSSTREGGWKRVLKGNNPV